MRDEVKNNLFYFIPHPFVDPFLMSLVVFGNF